MEKIETNINRFLPYGESLRAILQHPSIKPSDIKHLLRLKGIFVENLEDENTFPLILTNLLSPFEFQHLTEKIQSREDRDKSLNRFLEWTSSENLITAIPQNFNIQEIIKKTYPRYKVVGTPNFTMVNHDPDKINLDFKCETDNYSKEWYRAKNEFKGQITFEKVEGKKDQVLLQIIHTSPETMEISNKVIKHLENHFKDKKYINPNAEIKKIMYKDFSNEERMDFFLSFTQGNNIFDFEKASYLDVSYDPNETLPDNINWLDIAKVKELNINGEGLHNIYFIKDKTLHKFIELYEIEMQYKFSIPSAEGDCQIRFGFTGYLPKRTASVELVVDITKIQIQEKYSISQASVRTALLKEFEKMKTAKYEIIKTKLLKKQSEITI